MCLETLAEWVEMHFKECVALCGGDVGTTLEQFSILCNELHTVCHSLHLFFPSELVCMLSSHHCYPCCTSCVINSLVQL